MRPQFEQVTVPAGQSWALLWRELPDLPFCWHYHPEFELTFTVNARGQRYVGDDLADFGDGDLVLLGPDLPHTWSAQDRLDAARPMLAVVAWFGRDWLETLQRGFAELGGLERLAQGAARGLAFSPATAARVRPLLLALQDLPPPRRLAVLIEVLALLCEDTAAQPLASAALAPASGGQRERMARVLDHLHRHFEQPLSVAELAGRAALSEGAFQRFFKRHTGHTPLGYLAQLRIGRACQLLIQTETAIALIAEQAGYRNLAHFNRQFRAVKGCTPREFRARYR